MHSIKKIYVHVFMWIFARALAGLSHTDKETQNEIKGFEVGTKIRMMTLPEAPRFVLEVTPEHRFKVLKNNTPDINLDMKIKHLSHAFLLFSFQEGTTRSFANDRIVLDGDVSGAMIFVRCVNRVESIILPKFIAKMIVKCYPNIGFFEKVGKALRIYASIGKQAILGS